MKRRTLLAACAGALAVAAGCTDGESDDDGSYDGDDSGDGGNDDDDGSYDGDDSGDGGNDDERGGNTNLPWDVEVHPAVDVPDDATVLHAEDDDLTDLEILEELLEDAQREYDPETKDEFDEDERLYRRTPLVERQVTHEEAQAIQEVLDRDREYGVLRWCVEFEGTIFLIVTRPPAER